MAGRSIIVTGGFGALGRVVAAGFAAGGDRVARIDRAPPVPDASTGMLDLPDIDLADADAVARAVGTVAERHGGLDVLVNVAGGFVWETLEQGGTAGFERMFATNLLTVATVSRAALPFLRESGAGRIVNVGASAALQAAAGMGAYAASKAGVHRLTEALAAELADTAVTVNAVLPSIVDTPANRADMPDADTAGWVRPQAIADVILFLASSAARSVSGALIPVTHGRPE